MVHKWLQLGGTKREEIKLERQDRKLLLHSCLLESEIMEVEDGDNNKERDCLWE